MVAINQMDEWIVCADATRYGRACGAVEKVSALVHSPPLEGWQAKPDGVVVKVLNNVTPIDLLAQSAVLFFNSPMLALPYGAWNTFSTAPNVSVLRPNYCRYLR